MAILSRATITAVAFGLAVLTSPASAGAVTIGSLDLPAGGSGSFCVDPCTGVQGQVSPASTSAYTLKSPVDGTITGWSYRNGNVQAGNHYALRVLRPANPAETQFTAVTTLDAPVLPDDFDMVRGPFPASIPIKTGDRIALKATGPADYGVPVSLSGQNDPSTGDGARYIDPDVADGSTATPADPGNNGQLVLVQAQINETPPPPPPPPPDPDFTVDTLMDMGRSR